jgi:ribosomal protein S18 acetylase RimI-like enzyme
MPMIQTVPAEDFEARMDDAMAIYVAAMNYPKHAGQQRGRAARGQTTFPHFSARMAIDDDGVMVGFCYGYTSEDGQWWHELVRKALTDEQSGAWLDDAFELSELHVLPSVQGHGIGRRLLLSLAEGLPQRSMLLSTPDGDTRAFRLYRSLGFQDLARRHFFPGESRPFAVMGRRLPFAE